MHICKQTHPHTLIHTDIDKQNYQNKHRNLIITNKENNNPKIKTKTTTTTKMIKKKQHKNGNKNTKFLAIVNNKINHKRNKNVTPITGKKALTPK